MRILLILLVTLNLAACDKASDYIYDNFSLQKNIDMADEESRKNIDGDFKIDGFGYTFPPSIDRFIQNGFSYEASIAGEPSGDKISQLDNGQKADVYLKKDDASFYVEIENNTGNTHPIESLAIDYIEIDKADIADLDFSLGDITLGDALYDIKSKVVDKEIIELRQNTKDAQNDQYYMYLNGQYVVIFTLYQGKLNEVEIIPNERLANYEKK